MFTGKTQVEMIGPRFGSGNKSSWLGSPQLLCKQTIMSNMIHNRPQLQSNRV
jgi:hypothetical protein